MESNRQFSLHVSRTLDCLGKGQDMVKYRVEQYEVQERRRNTLNGDLRESILAGSKSEGLTAPCESDYDMMWVVNEVICADNTAPFRNINNVIVCEAERRNTAPGYTILRVDYHECLTIPSCIEQSLVKDCYVHYYISSDLFYDSLNQFNTAIDGPIPSHKSGPSSSFSINGLSQDFVAGFRYSCPGIIYSFITRSRHHGWPTDDQLTVISNLEGHVVPVGYKGSETAFLEWRICYTKAERFLMRSLNDTQTKTYILLKMVSKTYISVICKEITSYILKNIMLWLTEYCNRETFKEELLVDRLIQALVFLRIFVINNNLPSYMIPERNLFSGKLDLAQRQNLVYLLTMLIHKGGCLLLGCERLRCTMIVLYKEPDIAEQYRCKRDIIEKLWLMTKDRSYPGVPLADEDYNNIIATLTDIVLPDNLSLIQQGHDVWSLNSIYMTRESQWLS